MKKYIRIITVISLCFALLCGCATKDTEKPAEQPTPVAEPEALVELPNPVKSYTNSQEQAEAVGLGLEAPAGATDVSYRSIEDIAETVFTLEGVEYFYRAQPTGEFESYNMSGLYYNFAEPVMGTVCNREAAAYICDEAGFVQWLDIVPGINYNLSAVSKVSAEQLFRVAELVFAPVQGDVG